MPAKDRYHDTVVRALRKDGWLILGEQVDLMIAFDPIREEIVEWRHYTTP